MCQLTRKPQAAKRVISMHLTHMVFGCWGWVGAKTSGFGCCQRFLVDPDALQVTSEGMWKVVQQQRVGLLELRAEDIVLHEVPGHAMWQNIEQRSMA